jgi:outer membrane receptor protein involved in Fe transport
MLPSLANAQRAPASADDLARYDVDRNGVLDAREQAALDAARGVAQPAPAPTEDIVQMSPFEVSSATDRGYEATNTMSGTRINSRLEDLAASISVVTKQQLLDTASTDINDVFKYEANTEGIYQFTSFTVDRGLVTDDVSFNPQGATRVRGLSSANVARNGFTTTLPVDTYNVDSVEISRGPNSSLFGLGNTGGGVNIVGSKALFTRDVTSVTTRADSYDGYRGSFDLNRVLIKDKAGLRVLGLYDRKGYPQKPSEDTTRRLQVAVTYRPFTNTTIRASFESYRNFNRRPNSTTPRDMYADWVASGRPTWDPLTQTVHLANGTSIGPVTTGSGGNENTLLPYGLSPTDTGFTGRPSWYIDNGRIELYMINRMPDATATGIGPGNINGTPRLLQSGNFYTRYSAQYPLWMPKATTDRAYYDWLDLNIMSPNYSRVKGETSTFELEQIFLQSSRQRLGLQLAWLYERTSTNSRAFLSKPDGGKLQVFIDINEKLLDGTPNPYLLRPYVGGSEPAYTKSRNNNDNYRATLAYELDLARERNWVRWLGMHRFSGYTEYRSIYGGGLGFRDTMSSIEPWMTTTASNFSRNGAAFRAYPRYYVGDANGQNVDYAPASMPPPRDVTLRYYNGVTKQWLDEPTEFTEYYYANRWNKRLLSTFGGTWQGFFLDGRIVPTLGERVDNNRTRDGNSAISPSAATNGFYDTTAMSGFGQYDWVQMRPEQKGITRQAGIVVKPLRWLHLSYNQSNAFAPGSLAYDIYGRPLGDPRGKTKDYGFSLFLFNDRLVLTAKQYETLDIGRGSSEINTIVQRAIRLDADGSTTGNDPDLEGFLIQEFNKLHPEWAQGSAERDAAVLAIMGVDPDFIDSHRNKTHGDNSDAYSRGKEIEITYNPTTHWTLRGTITQAKTFNGIMSPMLQDYVNSRLPTWTTVKSPYDGSSFWDGTYKVGNLTPKAWYLQNLIAPMKLAVALQGKQRTQTREWRLAVVTNYKLAGLTENRWLKALDVGGAFRWEDQGSIGFYGAAPDTDGIVREYDPERPVWDKARYYLDLEAGYSFKLAKGKVRGRLQLNVRDVFEDGRLQPVAVNPNGDPWAFRIINPRQFLLTATFDL